MAGEPGIEDPAPRRRATQYLPDWQHSTPTLTTEQTRIPIHTPSREESARSDRTLIRDAFDGWAAAGSAANVAMQLGWPEVAYGVMESKVESGALMKHPWKRLRTTEQYLAVAILGTDEERAAYREAINTAHRQVRSTATSPVKYNAFHPELQLWVAACLYIGFEDTHQLLHGKMNDEQAEQFYQSASPLGTTLQVTADMWPASRKDFDHYWNVACERVTFDEDQKQFINDLVDLKMITPVLGLPLRGLLRFLTIGCLAPRFRDQLDLSWSAKDQRRFDNLFLFVGFVNRFLPRPLRFGAFYLIMRDFRLRLREKKALI
ncbi:oxygenase MpaB family protein [Mycolicibacterium conceptionense]|uniref:oxygenase MpaB family protein n=1 Tax=Mycolicibacterium conceptionense TaxID=451644 RepID=UPI001F255584|nr:oxygenase MpaB family protein [Mycolicibacterium conceptionense]